MSSKDSAETDDAATVGDATDAADHGTAEPAVDREPTEPDDSGRTPAWARAVVFGGIALALLLAGATIGLLIGRSQATSDAGAKPNDVDIGFSQDMSVHHMQAVTMADIAWDKTTDPDVKRMAFDIESTQTGQVGRMSGWLDLWGAPQQPSGPVMQWMPMDHMDMGARPEGSAMPGMASDAEMAKLDKLKGAKLDVYFLQLMLRHHQGGTHMASYAAKHAAIPVVRALAQKIIDSQGAEMITMRNMLHDRGAKPLPMN